MKVAFAANLDAELEFADPEHRPSTRLAAAMAARGAAIATALADALGADVVTLVPGRHPPAGLRDAEGLCWCPTPRALGLLASAAAMLPPAPPLPVLQRVNHRAFAAALAPRLPFAGFVTSLDDLDARLAALPAGTPMLLKRPFGFAGRGRKRVAGGAPLRGADRTWAEASMAGHGRGLQVEPFVEVLADFGQHGLVDARGSLLLGVPTRQTLDHRGSWLASAPVTPDDLGPDEAAALAATVRRVAAALHADGYFGPFGIDAYRWRAADGTVRFHALSEVNARLSMGFCAGMGSATRALLDRALPADGTGQGRTRGRRRGAE